MTDEAADNGTPRGPRPLEGVLVVAMEQAVAGPFATRHMADQGARVIKIERLDGGDFARGFDTLASGLGAHFTWLNRTKESLACDVKSPHGKWVLDALLARADVFLHNLAPGAAADLGFGATELSETHPRLIVCEISGYGTGGPYDSRRAYDLLIQSEAAVVSVTGTMDEPIKPGIAIADIAAGCYAYSSVLTALLARERTGRGCVLEVSMLDAVAEWMGYPVTVARHGSVPQMVTGMSHPAIAPYDAYRLADGSRIAVSVQNDREWIRLARLVLGREDLAEDPRFATNGARVENRAEVDGMVAGRLSELDFAEAEKVLLDAGLACAKINSVADLVDHPQLVARGRWVEVDSPVGVVPSMLPPASSSAWDVALGPIPDLGADNERVLAELGIADISQTA
ncbi:CaiB/BaiF CoA-transferase family protein [Gordonia sp. LSe1-13]|uniref:CaiB/BaiF CoA-transferase family protein n=1 Tax=Gordonia sesuvii TaxID=3116777 RepID=A0ABU7M927_9ACTN|nr:CaiB/BaiF CoA-transferase family protein [Gordonia sp. LSe1-13]